MRSVCADHKRDETVERAECVSMRDFFLLSLCFLRFYGASKWELKIYSEVLEHTKKHKIEYCFVFCWQNSNLLSLENDVFSDVVVVCSLFSFPHVRRIFFLLAFRVMDSKQYAIKHSEGE